MDINKIEFSKTALIVWDMQRIISSKAFNFNELVLNINLLLNAFRAKDKKIIYSKHAVLPQNFVSRRNIESLLQRGIQPEVFFDKKSPAWEYPSEIAPSDRDLVLEKHTPSFFIDTMVDYILKELGITVLIMTGVSTEIGVEATARHASYLGYTTVIAEDAVGSADKEAHELSLKLMRKMYPVYQTKQIVSRL